MCTAEALSLLGASPAEEEKLVSQDLQGNGYPKGFIQKHTYLQKTPCDNETRGSVTLAYISELAKSIHKALALLAIQVTFCPFRTLRQELVHTKDPVPAYHRKGVECTASHALNFLTPSLAQRAVLALLPSEHCQALKKEDLGSSVLAEHVFLSNHL